MNERIKELAVKVIWLTCADCAMTVPHQPCEACPNKSAQGM